MNVEATNLANSVIDKIAEKLNVAVDQVKPLAEEVIAQVQTTGIVFTIFFSVLFVSFVGSGIYFLFKSQYNRSNKKECWFYNENLTIAGFVLPSIGILAWGLPLFLWAIPRWIAPLPVILGI